MANQVHPSTSADAAPPAPADPGLDAEHSKRRWKGIFRSGAAAAAAKAVALVCTILQVPIALHYLGTEAFGLWMTLTNTVALISFADFGLGLGIQYRVAEAFGKDDPQRVRVIFNTGMMLMMGIGLVLFGLSFPVCYGFDWGSFFKIHDALLRKETPTALSFVLAVFFLGLPLNAIPRLAIGLQLGWLIGTWTAVGGVLSLIFVSVAAYLHLPFTGFLLFGLIPPILVNFCLAGALYTRLGWRLTDGWTLDWSISLPLIKQGALFLVPQLNTLVVGAAPQVLISATLGAAAVTPYNLIQRLLNIFNQALLMFIQPMWPAFAEAKARADWAWIGGAFRKAFAITAVVATVFCLGFSVAGLPFIRWWSRTSSSLPSHSLVYAMCVLTLITAIGQPGFCLLGSCNRLKGFSIYATATSLVFLAAAVPALKAYGPEGMVLLLAVSYAVFSLVGSLVEIFCWNAQFLSLLMRRVGPAKVSGPV